MEIPKMKVFVYVLTFLGYAGSGYGAGIISNLRDAILAAEHVFGDIFHNIVTVAKKFKIAHEVFDAAVEENCKYTCPDGKKCELLGCVREIRE
jgi:secretory phospholipase A2